MSNLTKHIPTVALSEITTEESALSLACQGELSYADIDSEYAEYAEAAQDDLGDIQASVPYIKADASLGVFCEPGLDKVEKMRQPNTLQGVILARKATPHLCGPLNSLNPDYKGRCQSAGFQSLLESEKWICRSSDGQDPNKAQLNSSLSPQQAAEARKIGIGGATGRGCASCPMAQWVEYGGKKGRLCSESESLIWLDGSLSEPKVLSIGGGVAQAKPLRQFIASKFKRGGKVIPLFAYAVRLAWKHVKEPGKEFFELVPTVIGAIEKSMLPGLNAVRTAQMWLLERASVAQAESTDVHHDVEDLPFAGPGEVPGNDSALESAVGGIM